MKFAVFEAVSESQFLSTGIDQNNGNATDIVHIFFINMMLDQLLPSVQPQSLE
jgi:hypothetical protein